MSRRKTVSGSIDPLRDALRTVVKEAIWSSPLRPRRSGERRQDIAIFASRRSGSTLLMQALAAGDGAAFADQPFGLYTASRAMINALPIAEYGQLIAPDTAELALVRAYTDEILAGSRYSNGPWRFWSPGYPWRWDRIVLKITDAKSLAPWLAATFDFQVVCMFRHPAAQSLSVIRNGWWTTGRAFLRNEAYRSQHLTEMQISYCWSVYESSTRFHHGVVDWCLENLALIRALQNDPTWSVVFYESLVRDASAVADYLASRCSVRDVDAMLAVLRQPSRSTRRGSTNHTRRQIRANDLRYLTERWLTELTDRDQRHLKESFDVLEIDVYSSDDPLPTGLGL